MDQYLIYLHAFFGGLALVSGLVPVISKKGSKNHKKFGRIFFFSLLLSSLLGLLITLLPSHENTFLLVIGIFTLYLLISGYRALSYRKSSSLILDKVISTVMVFVGIAMILYPIILLGKFNIVLSLFGVIGIAFATRDLIFFRDKQKLIKSRLRLHIGKISGAYIAAITAFLVVNQMFTGLISWIGPSVLGTIFIIYHLRRSNNGTWIIY